MPRAAIPQRRSSVTVAKALNNRSGCTAAWNHRDTRAVEEMAQTRSNSLGRLVFSPLAIFRMFLIRVQLC